MKRTILFAAAIASIVVVAGKAEDANSPGPASPGSQVHSIDLPHFMPYLPAGPDRELFASRCLSCHTMRYMTMQPLLTQAKWEDSVKKMIKTYGAPIEESEAPRLAQYLVALQHSEPETLARTVVGTAELPALNGGDVERGKQVYATSCAACHGATGKGDGPNMASLLPHATDLTEGLFAPVAIETAVVRGVGGTAMPSFASLSQQDLASVVAYTQQLGAKAQPAGSANPAAKTMFDSACASCHGSSGQGDGLNAPTLPRAPTNFQLRQPSADHALIAVTEGVPGTSMPSWKAKFDETQRKALADYVRSMYGSPAAP